MHDCSAAELHVNNQTDPDSQYYEPHANSQQDVSLYLKKLKCLDADSINVQGDFNSPNARSFVILFEKCDNSTS